MPAASGVQLGLFDMLRRPPVISPVEARGHVLQGDPDHVFTLAHPRMAWDRAEIEIHRHADGLWMWSTSWQADTAGSGYRVGAKWGKFAETREDALFYATEEIEGALAEKPGPETLLILKWVAALKHSQEAFK